MAKVSSGSIVCRPGTNAPSLTTRKARLGWAEALTNVSQTHAPDAAYEALTEHFNEQQIVDLSLIVATMNAWNRLAIGHRSVPPPH